MSIYCKIFSVKKLLCVLVMVLPLMAHAEYDEDNCRFFNPAYALCSVHSYNIGGIDSEKKVPANPTDAEQIAEMNEVIALKATVIAQQMKQQYDFLNATIKRFKTQLEKAVLTSKMEILTGTSASASSGSAGSSSSSKGIATATDCSLIEYDRVFDCLMGNLQKIQQTADNDTRNAREQLTKDLSIINNYGMCYNGKDNISCDSAADWENNCKGYDSNKSVLKKCTSWLYSQINMAKNRYNQSQRNSNYRW